MVISSQPWLWTEFLPRHVGWRGENSKKGTAQTTDRTPYWDIMRNPTWKANGGKMVHDSCSSGRYGFLGVCTLSLFTLLLTLSFNRAIVAADEFSSVSGAPAPILPSHEATLHPPLSFPPKALAPKCDRMFVSNANGPRNGTFYSPNFTNPGGHSRQCIYTFIAATDERIKVTFNSFQLRGAPPECNHEYLDLYTEVTNLKLELIVTPFGGRYCGHIPPRMRISLHQTLVIGFHSDFTLVDEVFEGNYEFVNSSKYNVGSLEPETKCSYTVNVEHKREGELLSPTYPGVYPKDLNCFYKFLGSKGQRIRLEFLDFDLFYGGTHCPFDHVKIYDGKSSEAPLIGTYCGQRRNLVIYSSMENLFVHFTTLQRAADSQNRGFSGWFEFSERYVNLAFISTNEGEHIKGTECDQKILSKQESSGIVVSPNYPFLYQQNTICRYFIYGLQDMQNLERVRIEFEKFEIPSVDQVGCTDAFLKLYLHGQEDVPAFDKHDHIFCGRTIPPVIRSEGPRLVMVFSSGSTQGQGFKAKYGFLTEYRIPGTPAPDRSCRFYYQSSSQKSGAFNSPRHPANYPSNITCTYMVMGQRNEQVRLTFDQFKMKTKSVVTDDCQNDWVELFNLFPDDSSQSVGRFCGSMAPGPIISDTGSHSMKVVFFTDEDEVASGFKARYLFEPRASIFGDCGENISGSDTGVLKSPKFPQQYGPGSMSCNWYIHVRPKYQVLLYFVDFQVEGDPAARGCPSAVVRVWSNPVTIPMELCGDSLTSAMKQIVSNGNMMRFTFITSDKAVGARGFKAVWTEVKEGPGCDQFHCVSSGFCVSKELRCNGLSNCGEGDKSDEEDCVQERGLNLYLLAGLVLGMSLVVLLGTCVWCHRKHKRRRQEAPPPEPRHVKHVCEVSGARFSSVDSV